MSSEHPLGPMGVGMKPRFDIMGLQFVDGRFAVDFHERLDVNVVPFVGGGIFSGLDMIEKGIEHGDYGVGSLGLFIDLVLGCVLGRSIRCTQPVPNAACSRTPRPAFVPSPRFWCRPIATSVTDSIHSVPEATNTLKKHTRP